MGELNRYLRLLDGDNPAGENLEYDDLYMQMEDCASNGDASLSMGDEEGKTADHKSLLKITSNLLERTRDFRVAVFHTIALTATQGFKGLKDGLTLLGFISVELWEQAYPQLDPDDDLDPTERLNILSALSPNSVNDPFGFINVLMRQPICLPLPINSREVKIAKGFIKSDEDNDIGLLKGQVLSLPETKYAEDYALIKSCLESAESLEQAINAQLTSGNLSLDKLKNELLFILRFLDEARGAPQIISESSATSFPEQVLALSVSTANSLQSLQGLNGLQGRQGIPKGQTLNASPNGQVQTAMAAHNLASEHAESAAIATKNVPSNAPVSAQVDLSNSVPLSAYVQLQQQVQQLQATVQELQQKVATPDIASLTIESRKDALSLIEKCRAYFQKKEPNSPIPFLMQRALRMADMDFIQLLGEIDSSALDRGREQLGVKNTEDN